MIATDYRARMVKACVNKKTYRTMKRAARIASRMMHTKLAVHDVRPYKCRYCPYYHIGGTR